jgi:uncharacterized protein (DUF1501 family)
MIDRRTLLSRGALFGAATLFAPRLAFAAAATEKRFVFVIQRGAADGLAILAPTGDPAFRALRPAQADGPVGAKLDGVFTLHPALAQTANRYAEGQALFAHAIASPYRERSHFDGQNVLETGGAAAYQRRDGWMNRMLALLPTQQRSAIAVAATVPTALRGPIEVASYAPSALPDASDDLLARVSAMYRADAELDRIWGEAMRTRALTADLPEEEGKRTAAATGALAASLLLAERGARIATIETTGWDTHTAQDKRLVAPLTALDAMIEALRAGLGPVWSETLVLVATEFGRTAAINGAGGTDHGTGSAAMLVGGAVKGGRVLADWPGLTPGALYQGRDLRPTAQLDAFVAGAVAEHFGLDPALVLRVLFPGAAGAQPFEGLVRV